jgi:hypothetical protein
LTLTAAPYLGRDYLEARAMWQRAVTEGLSIARAVVLANVASFKDCWTSRKKIAAHVGVSLRTVQRALTQGHDLGLIGKARAKKGETMPGAEKPQTCGFSHRWTVGRGLAVASVVSAVAAARLARIVKRAAEAVRPSAPKTAEPPPQRPPRPGAGAPRRRYTAEELEAELAKLPPVDERDPDPPPD